MTTKLYALFLMAALSFLLLPPAFGQTLSEGGAPAPNTGLAPNKSANARPDFEFEIVQLSFAQSDRVLGLLKALGYTVVEYSAAAKAGDLQQILSPVRSGEWSLPAILKVEDSSKTSILQPGSVAKAEAPVRTVPEIGGKYLHDSTTSEPLQRLLIVHHPDDPESLAKLLTLIRDKLDVGAQQVVIEALVLQVSHDAMKDLGVSYEWQRGSRSASFSRDETGVQQPFTFQYNDLLTGGVRNFLARLHALVGSGHAEVLSNPSVLVLDGRQARLQIGEQIPVVTSTVSVGVIAESVEYFPVGIVLNLRPRISADGSEVSMQVETIVSGINPTAASQAGSTAVFVAPVVSNVQVQTLVRVVDNTPFVIGGMMIEDRDDRRRGVPMLSKIPGLGALFRRRESRRLKREVLIVLTPHVIRRHHGAESAVDPANSAGFRAVTSTGSGQGVTSCSLGGGP